MARYRQKSSFINTIKDYIVPILWGIFIFLILIKIFTWNDNKDSAIIPSNNTAAQSLDIKFNTDNTQAFVSYSWNTQEQIDESINLYLWETITVKDGSITLIGTDSTEISLNKIAEFWFDEPNTYSLKSSEAWLKLVQDSIISMRYASITANAGSILSLTQNEAGSSIYIISWNARVSNLVGISSVLITWQKISISRLNASNTDVDLSGEKRDIDSNFKSSDWFLDNNGHIILEAALISTEQKETWDISPEETWTIGARVSFNNLRDEMNSDMSNIELNGTINSNDVEVITLNNKQATISSWTFSANIALVNWINDIVIKIYDDAQELLEKNIYTIYSSTPTKWTTTNSQINQTIDKSSQTINSQGVTTYDVNANDFGFTEPSVTGKYTTNFWEVSIRWITTATWISKVEVNWFELGSFNGSTWRYHAFERFETLEEGTNQYRIDYYGEDNTIVYTDYFIIVKQSGTANSIEETSQESTSSPNENEIIDEAT